MASFSVKQKWTVQRERGKKKGIALKGLIPHRSCGLSFASHKKVSHSIAAVSRAIYLTFCNKCATRLRISWSVFSPAVQTKHFVFVFRHIWLQKVVERSSSSMCRASQKMASFHVYDLPHEILISCGVGETNNLRQLIRHIRGEKKNMKKQLAQCGRL